MVCFVLNQQEIRTAEHPGTLLLDFIREIARLPGTKEACREGECGACTVLVGARQTDGSVHYKSCASCLVALGDVHGCHVVTVEGLSHGALTRVQQLLVDHSASQCGFCTPGFVLSLTGFCLTAKSFSNAAAQDALDGNLCRCTGYVAIRNAAAALCETLAQTEVAPQQRVAALIQADILPAYFAAISEQLANLPKPTPSTDANATLIAGGTDLLVQKPEQLRHSAVNFLSQRHDLNYVRAEPLALHVGGAVTLEDFRRAPEVAKHFPSLVNDLLLHSSTLLRNKATLSGNIVNASPIGDMSIVLLALDARLVLQAHNGVKRTLPLTKFFLSYKKLDLQPNELVTEIQIPYLPPGARFHFEKVSNRVQLDIAAVNSAVRLNTAPDGSLTELRLAAGGVAPIPLFLASLQSFCGKPWNRATAQTIAQAATAAVAPIDDVRGSASYKRLLLGQLVLGHFAALEGVEVLA